MNETLPCAYLVCLCKDYVITNENEMFLDILGYQSHEELCLEGGCSFLAMVSPEDIGSFLQYVADLPFRKKGEACNVRIRTNDNSYVWVSLQGKVLGTGRDAAYFFLCMSHFENISIFNNKEEQTSLVNMLNLLPNAVRRCKIDGDKISLDYYSDGLCQMTGYSRQEMDTLLKRKYFNLIHEADRENFLQTIEALKEYQHTETIEYRLVRKDGSSLWVSDTIKSARDSDGQQWTYSITSPAEEMQGQYNVEQVSDTLPCGVALYEYDDGKISLLYLNDAMRETSGYEEEEYRQATKDNLFLTVDEADVVKIKDRIQRMAEGANATKVTVRANATGGVRYIHLFMRVLHRQEKTFQISVMATDVTKYKNGAPKTGHKLENIATVSYPGPYMRTFGFFNVYLNGQAVPFHHQKAKELLALLVDQRGGYVSPGEMISCLWENEPVNKTTLAKCRKTFKQLKDDLAEAGITDILESNRSLRRVIPEKFGCDLYDYLSGDPQYEKLFKGAYLTNYSWGELTLSILENS